MVHVDVDRANLAHVTNQDVSDSIEAALHGVTAGVLRDGDKQIPIVGRMRMEERAQLSHLRSLDASSRGRGQLRCLSIKWQRFPCNR